MKIAPNFYTCLLTFLFYFNLSNASGIDGTNLVLKSGIAEISACRAGVNLLTFDYKMLGLGSASKYWDSMCGYPPNIGAYLLCTYAIGGNDTSLQNGVYKTYAKRCGRYSSYNYTASYYAEQFQNVTQYYVPLDQLDTSNPVYVATLPNMTKVEISYKNYYGRVFNLDVGTWFSTGIYGYFLVLFVISAIYNIFRITGFTKVINSYHIPKLIQKHLLSATLKPNGKFSQPYGFKWFTMLFPNRVQFFADLFLFGLQVAFYSVNYLSVTKSQWIEYIGFRSGIMAFGKIPLLILFAGRNNILLSITGWSYGTFLHFHKVLAGWMFVDSVIHSVTYTIEYLGYYVASLKYRYFACGIAATVLCGVLVLQSFHVFRNFFYEYFLVMHVMLAIGFISMCWYHCVELGWMEWMVAACCVWGFDRFVRIIRMSLFGYKTARIIAVGENMMKIEVPKPAVWRHSAGCYGFIYFSGLIFWENHPFTIVVEDNKLCAFITVKMGVTARMWKKLMKNKGEMNWKVCIEGPYGGNLSAMHKRYEDSLYVAGGSGAPGIIEAAAKSSRGKFIWVVPKLHFVTAYSKLVKRCNIPIDIYVTREKLNDLTCTQGDLFSKLGSDDQTTDTSEKESNAEMVEVDKLAQVSVYYGRPNMESVLDEGVRESQSSSVAIVACGPPAMMDAIRNVYSAKVSTWDKSVDFFDELVVW